ncbi:hypothetical protein HJFPF1_00378 [Paramyrothecium foliicola]|nr:hypothetical protein HJFPF1_00378 [Paramyrothecium foliicola]
MKSSPLLVFSTLLVAVCSWTIPSNIPDGIYHVVMPDDYSEGSDTALGKRSGNRSRSNVTINRLDFHRRHQRGRLDGRARSDYPDTRIWGEVGNPFSKSNTPGHELPYRPDSQWKETVPLPVTSSDCIFNELPLNLHDYEQARDGLLRYCDHFLVPARSRHIALSISGDVATYVCNSRKKPVGCDRKEWEWAEVNYFDTKCRNMLPAWVRMKKKGWNKEYGRVWKSMRICQDKELDSITWQGNLGDLFVEDEDH